MGILQARTPEWVAYPFSRGSSPTQGSNWGLLHCRRILYQLSYQGSPKEINKLKKKIFFFDDQRQEKRKRAEAMKLVSIPEPKEKAVRDGQGDKGCQSLRGFETESFPIYQIPFFLVSP